MVAVEAERGRTEESAMVEIDRNFVCVVWCSGYLIKSSLAKQVASRVMVGLLGFDR
jgi:hypothetical protein